MPSATATITALSVAAIVAEIDTEGTSKSVLRVPFPRHCSSAHEICDLLPLTPQVLEPHIDQLKLNRREVFLLRLSRTIVTAHPPTCTRSPRTGRTSGGSGKSSQTRARVDRT